MAPGPGGEARPDSDVDVGVYYLPDRPPSVAALRRLARELDDRHVPDLVTDFGEWRPWIDGGGWLRIGGRPVDWLYRDLDRVARTIEECRAGRPTYHYQPGHPHGFLSHIYAGEVHHSKVLYDPRGSLTALKALTADSSALSRPGESPDALTASVGRLEEVLRSVGDISAGRTREEG